MCVVLHWAFPIDIRRFLLSPEQNVPKGPMRNHVGTFLKHTKCNVKELTCRCLLNVTQSPLKSSIEHVLDVQYHLRTIKETLSIAAPWISSHISTSFSHFLILRSLSVCLHRAQQRWRECTTSNCAPYPAGRSIDMCGRALSPWWYPPEIHEGFTILTASQRGERKNEREADGEQNGRL